MQCKDEHQKQTLIKFWLPELVRLIFFYTFIVNIILNNKFLVVSLRSDLNDVHLFNKEIQLQQNKQNQLLNLTTYSYRMLSNESSFATSYQSNSKNVDYPTPKVKIHLHELMHEHELKVYLGHTNQLNKRVTNLENTYEILHLDQIDGLHSSNFTRVKRSIRPDRLKIKFKSFGQNFVLDLMKNENFVSSQFTIHKDLGEKTFKNIKNANNLRLDSYYLNCFYYGNCNLHVNSSAALSICDGIRGLIETQEAIYVINPLTEYLIERINNLNQDQPLKRNVHLILRKQNLPDYECPHYKFLYNNSNKNTNLNDNLNNNPTNNPTDNLNDSSTDNLNDIYKSIANLNLDSFVRKSMQKLNRNSIQNHQFNSFYLNGKSLDVKHKDQKTKRSVYWQQDYFSNTKPIKIETAVFVDEQLFKFLNQTFIKNSEQHIITYILTIMNAVQILFKQKTLQTDIQISVVSLNLLTKQPEDLQPSDNIDTYLTNFCIWQHHRRFTQNGSNSNWDHALLLSGINMYVIDNLGEKRRHVVGLAPVSGMCNSLNSCTISEGTSFQTVLVAGHEMGHNLGMEHDGPSDSNTCDPNTNIMSPSLGLGKSTFSKCSTRYLLDFIKKPQAKCLFEQNIKPTLNDLNSNFTYVNLLENWHGLQYLPGELYGLTEQCIMRFGFYAKQYLDQKEKEICSMIKCQIHTGNKIIIHNAHPALEGTRCGKEKWCKKGECVLKETISKYLPKNILNTNELVSSSKLISELPDLTTIKTTIENKSNEELKNLLPYHLTDELMSKNKKSDEKFEMNLFNSNEHLIHNEKVKNLKLNLENKLNLNNEQNNWAFNQHLVTSNLHKWTNWSDWSSCTSKFSLNKQETFFGFQISTRKCLDLNQLNCIGDRIRIKLCFDSNINFNFKFKFNSIDEYINKVCKMISRINSSILPKGTQYSKAESNSCFVWCLKKTNGFVSQGWQLPNGTPCSPNGKNKYCFNGECRSFDCTGYSELNTKPCPYKTISPIWMKEKNKTIQLSSTYETKKTNWIPLVNCKSSCLVNSRPIRLVSRNLHSKQFKSSRQQIAFQLCSNSKETCSPKHMKTPEEYATKICAKYKLKYPLLLSGKGKQLMSSNENINASCIVSCTDLKLPYVHYEMDSILDGYFPLGTRCSTNNSQQTNSFCLNGKCIEFDEEGIALVQSFDEDLNKIQNVFNREMIYIHRPIRSIKNRRNLHSDRNLSKHNILNMFNRSKPVILNETLQEISLKNRANGYIPSNLWSTIDARKNFLRENSSYLYKERLISSNKTLILNSDHSVQIDLHNVTLFRRFSGNEIKSPPAKHSWHVEKWSECSSNCGQQGVQTRNIVCIQTTKIANHFKLKTDQFCNHLVRPFRIQECNLKCNN